MSWKSLEKSPKNLLRFFDVSEKSPKNVYNLNLYINLQKVNK